jgi:hypothetical protein
MSGRIRTVKPEWLEDELLALASSDARVLSIALMLLADDHGRGRANPVMLAGQVFPGKPLETLSKALEELKVARYVIAYEVDGQSYFAIRNWEKHQKVDKPGKERVPAPSGSSSPFSSPVPTLEKVPETSANPRASRGSEVQVQVQVGVADTGPDPGRDIQALATAYLRDEFTGSNGGIGGGVATHWPEVLAVCGAFQRAWGRPVNLRSIGLKDPRLRVVLERLAEGFTVAQLELAIQRSRHADYIAGNQANQALQTILRDAGQVEKFGALTQAPRKPERLDPRNEAQDRNADHESRRALQASRRVREFLEGAK